MPFKKCPFRDSKKRETFYNQSLKDIYRLFKEDPIYTKINALAALDNDLIEFVENIRTHNGYNLAASLYINKLYPEIIHPYAVDKETYSTFKLFYEKLLKRCYSPKPTCPVSYYNIFSTKDINSNSATVGSYGSDVSYCEIIIRRNLEAHNFLASVTNHNIPVIVEAIKSSAKKLFYNYEPVDVPDTWIIRLTKEYNSYVKCFQLEKLVKYRRVYAYLGKVHNNTVGYAINYVDHLQILGSTTDGNIRHLCGELVPIECHFKMDLNFARHTELGYLTVSTEYLGSGTQIKTKINAPISTRLPDLHMYLNNFNLYKLPKIVKDKRTENTVSIINRPCVQFAKSIVIQNILDGITFLLEELERDLKDFSPKTVHKWDMVPVENLSRLIRLINKSKQKTYTKKYLTTYMVQIMADRETRHGGKLAHCVRVNAFHKEVLYPRACDPESYATFNMLFILILHEHNRVNILKHPAMIHYGQCNTEMDELEQAKVLSHRIRFVRNFDNYPFSMLINSRDRKTIDLISRYALLSVPGTYYTLSELMTSKKDRAVYNSLLESDLVHKVNDLVRLTSGAYRDWPNDRGIFVHAENNADSQLAILINDIDHFCLYCIDWTGKDLCRAYTRATTVLKHIDTEIGHQFAHRSNLGFLTTRLSDTGTGLRLGCRIHFRGGVSENREWLRDFCRKHQLKFQSVDGQGTRSSEKNIFDVHTNVSLGLTEYETLNDYISKMNLLMSESKNEKVPRCRSASQSRRSSAQRRSMIQIRLNSWQK